MPVYQLKRKQKVKASLAKVWDFVSSPKNLKTITPDHMGFEIITEGLPEKMYPGMMIAYHVKPLLGIKMLWLTEITQVEEKKFFVDEQRIGPYKIWHHEHHFQPVKGGVLMEDIITYQLPLPLLSSWLNKLMIEGQLKKIFDYREKKLNQIWP